MPQAAGEAGIQTIYQDIALIKSMPIMRNIHAGRESTGSFGSTRMKEMHESTMQILKQPSVFLRQRVCNDLDFQPAASLEDIDNRNIAHGIVGNPREHWELIKHSTHVRIDMFSFSLLSKTSTILRAGNMKLILDRNPISFCSCYVKRLCPFDDQDVASLLTQKRTISSPAVRPS